MRRVHRLLAAYACGSLAIGLPWPLLLVLVWDRYGEGPHGAWVVGLAGAARMAPYVLLSWAVGSLGDHVRRDLLVRTTMALRVLFLGVAAVALAQGHVGLGVGAAGLAVLSATPAYPAIAAGVPRLAGPLRARATEWLVTIEVSSWVVGPALGGLLLTPGLRSWTLPVAVALAGLGLALSAGIIIPGPAERAPDAVAGMLRAVIGRPVCVAALGLAGLLNLVITVIGVVLLPMSTHVWRTGDSGFGAATACLGFGALGAPLLARLARRLGGTTRSRALAVLATAVVVVAVTPVPWPALPLLALAGAAAVLVESTATRTMQEAVPDGYRAGALGLMDSVMVGACLVGSLVAPPMAQASGARTALLLVALATLLPLLAARLAPAPRLGTLYDAAGERARTDRQSRPDTRGAPAVGPARVV